MNYKDVLEVPRIAGRVRPVRVATAYPDKKVYTDLVKSKPLRKFDASEQNGQN